MEHYWVCVPTPWRNKRSHWLCSLRRSLHYDLFCRVWNITGCVYPPHEETRVKRSLWLCSLRCSLHYDLFCRVWNITGCVYPPHDETKVKTSLWLCSLRCSLHYDLFCRVWNITGCVYPRHDETRGVSGYVPLGAACTTICFVEYGTLLGVCTHPMTRQEESLVMFP